MDDTDSNISRTVRALLVLQDHTREELAEALQVKVSAVNMKLRGERGWRAREVRCLAEFFHVSMDTLANGIYPIERRHQRRSEDPKILIPA